MADRRRQGRYARLALDALEGQLRRTGGAQATTSLLVYYSGHAKMGDLRLGQSRWAMQEIKQRLKDSAADIKIGIIDPAAGKNRGTGSKNHLGRALDHQQFRRFVARLIAKARSQKTNYKLA